MAKTPAHIEALAISMFASGDGNRPKRDVGTAAERLAEELEEGRPIYGHEWSTCRPTVRSFYRRLARVTFEHLGDCPCGHPAGQWCRLGRDVHEIGVALEEAAADAG